MTVKYLLPFISAISRKAAKRYADRPWNLVGTIAGDADDRGNIDTGIDVDLTGCTELYFEAKGIGSSNVILRGVVGSSLLNVVIPIISNTERITSVLYQDNAFGTFGMAAKSSAVGSLVLGGSVSIFNIVDIHINDFTGFNFDNPAVVTSCEIEIYAR